MTRPRWLVVLFVAALTAGVRHARADKWAPPEARKYFSVGDGFRFQVTPGAHQDVAGDKRKCEGTLAKREGGDSKSYAVVWTKPLVNKVAPLNAIVSPDGRYVATFDNWAHGGYGPNALVLYRTNGALVRSMSLLDFLVPEEIARLGMSVSSVWWYEQSYFRAGPGGAALELHVTQQRGPGQTVPTIVVNVDAASGKPLRGAADLKAIDAQRASCRKQLQAKDQAAAQRRCSETGSSIVWCAICAGLREP